MESDDPVIHRRPAEPVERLHEQLRESLQVLVTSEDWRQALAVAARFHDYSFANTRLIWSAAAVRGFAPHRVAGYRTWQKLGRGGGDGTAEQGSQGFGNRTNLGPGLGDEGARRLSANPRQDHPSIAP